MVWDVGCNSHQTSPWGWVHYIIIIPFFWIAFLAEQAINNNYWYCKEAVGFWTTMTEFLICQLLIQCICFSNYFNDVLYAKERIQNYWGVWVGFVFFFFFLDSQTNWRTAYLWLSVNPGSGLVTFSGGLCVWFSNVSPEPPATLQTIPICYQHPMGHIWLLQEDPQEWKCSLILLKVPLAKVSQGSRSTHLELLIFSWLAEREADTDCGSCPPGVAASISLGPAMASWTSRAWQLQSLKPMDLKEKVLM